MKQYEVKYIELKTGEKIAYREAGKGKQTILLVHGNMSSSVHFQPLMELLERYFKVYALDMVGFGDSSYNRQIDSIHDFSEDVTEFIVALNLKDVYLVGWSTGGGVVLETSVDIPDRIKKVFLLSSVGVQGYPVFKLDNNLKPDFSKPIFLRDDLEKDTLSIKPALFAFSNKDRDFFRLINSITIYNIVKPKSEDIEIYLDTLLKQRNLVDVNVALANFNMTTSNNGVNSGTGRLYQMRVPIIIIHGDHDQVVPIEFAKLSKKFIGERAELVVFEGMGHSLLTDDLDRVYVEIVSRIERE